MPKIYQLYLLFCLNLFLSPSLIGQSYSIGGGIVYNATLEVPGLNFRAYHNIGEHFCFGPEFAIFLSKETSDEEKNESIFLWEINLMGHYIFEISENLGFYPIIGLNYTKEKETIEYLSTDETDTATQDAFGLNMGSGFHVPINKITPFLEYTYVASSLSEHSIIAGIFYTFGSLPPEEEEEVGFNQF